VRRVVPTAAFAFLVALSAAGPVQAEVWRDPTLREALSAADLVVRAVATEDGSEARPEVRFRAEEVLSGKAPATFAVGGLIDPTRIKGPTFIRKGQRMLLLLKRRKKGEGYTIPTPTFGRFRITDQDLVKHAALRDTLLRLDLARSDYEAYLRLRLNTKPDPVWIRELCDALQRSLKASEVDAPARAKQYLALEVLAQAGGGERERALVAACWKPEQPFQLRVSACRAAARVLGAAALKPLTGLAREDKSKAVRIAAIRSLAGLRVAAAKRRHLFVGLLPKATTEPFRLSHGPNDPRTNRWASPKVTLLKAIARLDPAPVKGKLLAMLEEASLPLPVFSATLLALLEIKGDASLPKELIKRFRTEAEVGARLYNRELCAALTRLTKRGFKEDLKAWRRWAAKQ
jgi:hypothetical protein